VGEVDFWSEQQTDWVKKMGVLKKSKIKGEKTGGGPDEVSLRTRGWVLFLTSVSTGVKNGGVGVTSRKNTKEKQKGVPMPKFSKGCQKKKFGFRGREPHEKIDQDTKKAN